MDSSWAVHLRYNGLSFRMLSLVFVILSGATRFSLAPGFWGACRVAQSKNLSLSLCTA